MKFYFSVILPSINYGLVLWSSCCNLDFIKIQLKDCTVGRQDYFYVIWGHGIQWSNGNRELVNNQIKFRGHEVAAIRRYKSRVMKDSLAYRGSILWNVVNYNDNLKTTNVNVKELKKRFTARDNYCWYFR